MPSQDVSGQHYLSEPWPKTEGPGHVGQDGAEGGLLRRANTASLGKYGGYCCLGSSPPFGRWIFVVGAHSVGDGLFCGSPPRGRWFSGRVPHPSPKGVVSYKKTQPKKKPAEAGLVLGPESDQL